MPMLERTATTLEPCHLHRVLPPTKAPFKSSRRLHTAFWQHGASDIELSNVWQALIREPLEVLSLIPSSMGSNGTRNDSFGASTFLLDFLYPQGAASLLRKLSPSVLDRYERPQLYLRGALPRFFGSSASRSQVSRDLTSAGDVSITAEESETAKDESAAADNDALARIQTEIAPVLGGASTQTEIATLQEPVRADAAESDAPAGEVAAQEKVMEQPDSVSQIVPQQSAPESAIATTNRLVQLRSLLRKDREKDFEMVWHNFHKADDAEELRSGFVDFITKHRSMTHLLAKSLKGNNLRTFWLLWARYFETCKKDAEVIDWGEFERYTGLDQAPPVRYRTPDRPGQTRGLPYPTHFERLAPDNKVLTSLATLIEQLSNGIQSRMWLAGLGLDGIRLLVNNFIHPIMARYHHRLRLQTRPDLPGLLKNAKIYQVYLQHTAMDPKLRHISDRLYKEYRLLPDVNIDEQIMVAMVHHVYKPVRNAEGMDMVLHDLYRFFPILQPAIYRVYIRFYAEKKDVKTTQRLFTEYRTNYAAHRKLRYSQDARQEDAQQNRYPDFQDLLLLYAERGELGEVRRVFNEAQADFGPTLTTKSWNILLLAHIKAGEYDAAVRVFAVLKQAVPASIYSWGMIMGMSGSRGDLEFTLELYRNAKSEGIEPNSIMVDAVVEAYCQNDKLKDAERIIKKTTEKKSFRDKDLTYLWNSLLYHFAARRDLKALNDTLTKMTEYGLPYNSETYGHLLRGLAWCGQSQHALFLMQQAIKNRAFKPKMEHYTLLMGAFQWTGQTSEALRTSTTLRNLGLPQTGDLLLRVLQAMSAWATKNRTRDADTARAYLVSMLRQFRQSIERSQESTDHLPGSRVPKREPWIDVEREPITVRQRTEQANILVYTFTLMRQATDVQGVMELYTSSSPEASNSPEPPILLLSSLMHHAFYQGNLEEVRELWQRIFDRAQALSRVSAPGTDRSEPLPAARFMLNEPLKTMQRMHAVTADPDGLRQTVNSVIRAGFRLDSKNWNYYVQLLAGLKRWREAFLVAEEVLMPSWQGWRRVRAKLRGVRTVLPLDVRRKGLNPEVTRPISHTLLVLSKAFMDLEKMTAWSNEAERLQRYIETECPACVAAVKSAIRANSGLERRILQEGNLKDSRDKTFEELAQEQLEKRGPKGNTKITRRQRETMAKAELELQDDEMPQSFLEMIKGAVPDDGTVLTDDYSEDGDAEAPDDVTPAGSVEADDGEWVDVDDHNDDDWTPMVPQQGHGVSTVGAVGADVEADDALTAAKDDSE